MGLTAMRRRKVKKNDELSKAQKERAAKTAGKGKEVKSEKTNPEANQPKKKKGFFGGSKR